jgi:hypothetical protein
MLTENAYHQAAQPTEVVWHLDKELLNLCQRT